MLEKFKSILKSFQNISDPQGKKDTLTSSLETNIKILQEIFSADDTIIFRRISNQHHHSIQCCMIYVKDMVNRELLNKEIITPIMYFSKDDSSEVSLKYLIEKVLPSSEIEKSSDMDTLVSSVLQGNALLILDHFEEALMIDVSEIEYRSTEEPASEPVVRGPREGFTESLEKNCTLIRKRITSPKLKFTFREIGSITKTKIGICYIEGVASEKILKELHLRLDKIDIDGIIESEYIEEFIQDASLSIFKTIGNTERPDVAAAKLLEGRIVLLCNGTPFALTLPFVFIEYLQANEDYYQGFLYASFNRLLRHLAFFLTTSTPALYIALTTYHQELIPTPLILSIASARQGVPFPTVVEAMIMLIGFEILREAGVRLPKPVGQAISIVGALVLGDAAVAAKLISAPMVIVVAATGITSFMLPKMLSATLMIRFIFLFLAAFLGLYGYMFGVIGLGIYLVSVRSFGVPYMLNINNMTSLDEIKDTSLRIPWWMMHRRPKEIGKKNPHRQS